jgi:hypothetical protein
MASKKHTDNGSHSAASEPEVSPHSYPETAPNLETAHPVDPSPDPIRVQAEDKPVEILSKIVAKDIVKRSQMNYRKDDDGKVENSAPRSLYRVFGVTRGSKTGDSQYGTWLAFIGSFEAIRFSDRQRFQAPLCFLQGASEGLLLDALIATQKNDPTNTVMFAFDIGVKPSDKWVTEDKGNSYEYTVRTVLKTQQHDPLKEIRELSTHTLPALPPPAE